MNECAVLRETLQQKVENSNNSDGTNETQTSFSEVDKLCHEMDITT